MRGRPFYFHFTEELRLINTAVFQAYIAGEGTPETWTQFFKPSNLCTESTGEVELHEKEYFRRMP